MNMASRSLLLLATLVSLLGQPYTAIALSSNGASEQNQCQTSTLYKSSLPAGGSGVEHLKVLGVGLKADDCISKCCALGPSRCQYLWVLEETCIAVACEVGKESSCRPYKVAPTHTGTVYVQMKYPHAVNNLEQALEWVKDLLPLTTDKVGDSPPVADTGLDEVVVTLPTSDVYLYGNSSKDDKGITSYSWKLLSEHFVQPILENTKQAILHVRNLKSGTYKFSLTVTDTGGQSGQATVIVHVNKGPTHTEAPTVVTTEKAVERTTQHTVRTTAPPPSPSQPTEHDNEQVNTSPTTLASDNTTNQTASVEELDKYYTKRRNVLKIVIPVLLSVAVLLVVSAAIVTCCACCCERNKHRMKKYYRYKRLPETIEKT